MSPGFALARSIELDDSHSCVPYSALKEGIFGADQHAYQLNEIKGSSLTAHRIEPRFMNGIASFEVYEKENSEFL